MTTEALEKEILKKINAIDFDDRLTPDEKKSDVKSFLALIQQHTAEVAEDICKLIDGIELKDENKSMEQWKQYKHIRNSIRDKYLRTEREQV